MAALTTAPGTGGDLCHRYKHAVSNTPGGWDLILLWNTSRPLSLWLHACKQYSKFSICALSALQINQCNRSGSISSEQLVLRYQHLCSVSYRAFLIRIDISSGPETKICITDMIWRCLKDQQLVQTFVSHLRLGCIRCPPQFELSVFSKGKASHEHQNYPLKWARGQEVQMIRRFTSKPHSCLQLIALIFFFF